MADATGSSAKRALGDHTVFLGDPVQEALFSMTVALMSEVSVLRDRLDAHERLLSAAGLPLSPAQVDAMQIDAQVAAERGEVRMRMMRNVFRVLGEKLPPEVLRAQSAQYGKIFEELHDSNAPSDILKDS